MKKKIGLLLLPMAAILLELLPYGAVLVFASPDERIRKTFSYFSLTPFGYANFGPFLTASASCLLVILLGIYRLTDSEKLLRAAKYLSYLAVAFSILPILYGLHFYSVTGGLISLILLGQAIILYREIRMQRCFFVEIW